MKLTQKLTTASLATAVYLGAALPAFAANTGFGCPQGVGEGNVCNGPADFKTLISTAISYLFIIAAVVAIIFLIWGGIKWITSSGDKAKVESARGTIIGAIVGLVIVFASWFIINIVLQTFFGINLANLELPQFTN